MRPTIFLSAALLISPALAAPLAAPQDVHGVSANMNSAQAQPAPASAAAPCTNSRRSWVPFWRRQTITGANDCSFMIASGTTRHFRQ